MDRMSFIPGQEAREELEKCNGHIFFGRSAIIDLADEFLLKRPGGFSSDLSHVYMAMLACVGEGEQVDIRFGLRDVDPAKGDEEDPSGELVGHTWATVRDAAGKERHLWEVGRRTPAASEAQATRAFIAYRNHLALFRREPPPPDPPQPARVTASVDEPREWQGKPVISRALAPSNLYFSSSRMWYFVELTPPGDDDKVLLTRPMRAFDALMLAAALALVFGSPPLVFGISNSLEGLGKMPTGYTRTHYEADERILPTEEKPLLVM